ncbi:MAG: ankyrin repeat domain-containing protein [Rickettsiaceae bacterium]
MKSSKPIEPIELFNIPVSLTAIKGGWSIEIGHLRAPEKVASYQLGTVNKNSGTIILRKNDATTAKSMYPVIKVQDDDSVWTQPLWHYIEDLDIWKFQGKPPEEGIIIEFDTENVLKDMCIIEPVDQPGALGRVVSVPNPEKYEKQLFKGLKNTIDYTNSPKIIKNMVENHAKLESRKHDFNELSAAVRSGNLEAVKIIVDARPELLNTTNSNGQTALHYAARLGKTDVLSFFIVQAVMNLQDTSGYFALDYAIKENHIVEAALLLRDGRTDSKYRIKNEKYLLKKNATKIQEISKYIKALEEAVKMASSEIERVQLDDRLDDSIREEKKHVPVLMGKDGVGIVLEVLDFHKPSSIDKQAKSITDELRVVRLVSDQPDYPAHILNFKNSAITFGDFFKNKSLLSKALTTYKPKNINAEMPIQEAVPLFILKELILYPNSDLVTDLNVSLLTMRELVWHYDRTNDVISVGKLFISKAMTQMQLPPERLASCWKGGVFANLMKHCIEKYQISDLTSGSSVSVDPSIFDELIETLNADDTGNDVDVDLGGANVTGLEA